MINKLIQWYKIRKYGGVVIDVQQKPIMGTVYVVKTRFPIRKMERVTMGKEDVTPVAILRDEDDSYTEQLEAKGILTIIPRRYHLVQKNDKVVTKGN